MIRLHLTLETVQGQSVNVDSEIVRRPFATTQSSRTDVGEKVLYVSPHEMKEVVGMYGKPLLVPSYGWTP